MFAAHIAQSCWQLYRDINVLVMLNRAHTCVQATVPRVQARVHVPRVILRLFDMLSQGATAAQTYAQWRGWMRILSTLRASFPDMVRVLFDTTYPRAVGLCVCVSM